MDKKVLRNWLKAGYMQSGKLFPTEAGAPAKNVKAFLTSVRETIKGNRSEKQETLINLLNPKIRGWANYHRHIVAKDMFVKEDNQIWQALWRWARRRHPWKKPRRVRRRYFRTPGG